MTAYTHWFGHPLASPPVLTSVLLIDDNDRYAGLLAEGLGLASERITRCRDAASGIAAFQSHHPHYDGVITDISMETELAGLRVLRAVRATPGYTGVLASATTAVNHRHGFWFNRWFFRWRYRADYLIPKRPLSRDGTMLWLALRPPAV